MSARRENEGEDPLADTRMSLGEHLDELRTRLIKGAAAVLVAFVAAWTLRDAVQDLVTWPFHRAMDLLHADLVSQALAILEREPGRPRTDFFVSADPADERLIGFQRRLSAIKPAESFLFTLRICFYTAIVFGAPVLLWQMWRFVAAGLYTKERRMVLSYFPVSVLAFAAGVVFGFSVIVPYGMFFLNKGTSIELIAPSITVEYYLTFLSGLCLAFGAVFQLPLLMTFLARTGIVEVAVMSKYRGHFIVGAFVIGAMLTPPDPFTQLMMAIPLVVLFEVGLLWSRRIVRRQAAESGR